LDEWMEERRNTVSARTWRVQESMIRGRVKPGIGDYRLCKLAGKDVRQMYRRLITRRSQKVIDVYSPPILRMVR
jgi:Phage integrase, N-terminal SAM-like domain